MAVTTGKIMMIDTSKCMGCKACQVACKQWHQLPAEDTTFTGSYQNPPELSAANLNVVNFIEADDGFGGVKWLFFPNRCRHCDVPPCLDYCPLDAIVKTRYGQVIITRRCRPRRCSRARVKPCQQACPYKDGWSFKLPGTPRYRLNDKETQLVDGKMNKCDFCYDRRRNTKLNEPKYRGEFTNSNKAACELVCPTGAIRTGRARPINRAVNERILWLRDNGFPQASKYPRGLPAHMLWVLTEHRRDYGLRRIT